MSASGEPVETGRGAGDGGRAARLGGAPASWAVGWLVALLAVIAFWDMGGAYRTEIAKGFGAMLIVAAGAMGLAWAKSRRRCDEDGSAIASGDASGADAGRRGLALPAPVLLLGAMWGWVLLVMLIAGPTYWGGYQIAKSAGLFAVMLVIANTFDARRWSQLGRPLGVLVLFMLVAWGIGAIAAAAGLRRYDFGVGVPLYLAFGNPNRLGGFLVMVLPLLLVGLIGERGRRWKLTLALAVVGALVMILASQSRNALATSVIIIALFALLYQRCVRRRPWGRSLLPVGLILGATLLLGVTLAPGAFGRAFSDQSFVGRSFLYRAAMDMITDSPADLLLGQGSGHYRAKLMPIPSRDYGVVMGSKNTLFIHNEYLELWFEGGLIALGLFVIAAGWTLWAVFRAAARAGGAARSEGHGDDHGRTGDTAQLRQRWLIAVGLSLVAFLIFGSWSVASRYAEMQFMFAIVFGGAGALLRHGEGDDAPNDAATAIYGAPALKARLGAAVVSWAIVAVVLFATVISAAYFRAERDLRGAKLTAYRQAEPDFDAARDRLRDVAVLGVPAPEALHEIVLINFIVDAPLDAARADFERLQAAIPAFKSSGMVFARHLFQFRQPAEAIAVVRRHLDAHPFHTPAHIDHCVYPFALNDQAMLVEALTRMLHDMVQYVNMTGMAELVYRAQGAGNERRVMIHSPAAGATFRSTAWDLPGHLFGRTPADDHEARRLLAARAEQLFGQLGLDEITFPAPGQWKVPGQVESDANEVLR